jgi:hypothetical protein
MILPEADASFADKFKNRVDYAILQDGLPVMAVECKKVSSLTGANRGELKGYYNAVPTVKLGILTDGLIYQLYSDTEEENLMDDEPFAVVNLAQVSEEKIADDTLDALVNLRRGVFDPDNVGAEARRKLYISAYVEALDASFKDPDENIVRTLMDVTGIAGKKTAKLLNEHKRYITEAMSAFFEKKLLERLGLTEAPKIEKTPPKEEKSPEEPEKQDMGITTTDTELEVYDYVRYRLPFLIARDEDLFHKLEDIDYRDYKGTFAVSYKQVKKGRLFNIREGTDTKYRFEFPDFEEQVNTNILSDIDDKLLAVFMKRVEELG